MVVEAGRRTQIQFLLVSHAHSAGATSRADSFRETSTFRRLSYEKYLYPPQ
ncbi:hypothetical protein PORUE0001_0105 [Porphyromonas uenonis 60-3]|uniref:Uncharacterized protein n=1 Tax=Porphyromonas uenonis 60-3 TaxID=596327 RepID=C2MB59_9PORP|nr:hypothetical protein PORUE0001_0105 [Porphyromonas uenonis 60-3]